MTKLVKKLNPVLRPDSTRTVIRPFALSDPHGFELIGHPRTERIAQRVLSLDEAGVKAELKILKDALDDRHREPERMLFDIMAGVEGLKIDRSVLSHDQTLLLGAYFSEEFSFESAALFNPSIVRHPDQSSAHDGDTRFVLSLRGIGEGHISSLTFRTGTWTSQGDVSIDTPSAYAVGPYIDRTQSDHGELVVSLSFDRAEDICESVIYPFMPSQGRGIEDVRMVEFTDDDGSVDYRATYTAFNGADVRQGLMRTRDFKNFELRGVRGELYAGKGMALFPRKIDGRYFMLSRQDNENLWLTSSDDFSSWGGGEKIIPPKWPWEFIQIGNCGSPIELDEGWLVLTHGVGIVRSYCVGACLLDKKKPSKLLARLEKPLLEPDGDARDGYVPNVVYSCGAILRDRTLLLPYGEADNFATFATVDVDALVAAMS